MQGLLPGQDMLVDAVDQRAVQVEEHRRMRRPAWRHAVRGPFRGLHSATYVGGIAAAGLRDLKTRKRRTREGSRKTMTTAVTTSSAVRVELGAAAALIVKSG